MFQTVAFKTMRHRVPLSFALNFACWDFLDLTCVSILLFTAVAVTVSAVEFLFIALVVSV